MYTSRTNSILVDVRAGKTAGRMYAGMLADFTICFESVGHFITTDWVRITDAGQIDHARRVLARLASLEAS